MVLGTSSENNTAGSSHLAAKSSKGRQFFVCKPNEKLISGTAFWHLHRMIIVLGSSSFQVNEPFIHVVFGVVDIDVVDVS